MSWLYRFGVRPRLDLLVAVLVLCILFMALEPRAEAGVGNEGVAFASGVGIAAALGRKNEIRIVQPAKGAHISGKIHIKLKVGQNIKKVFVFIDDKYFASGPPFTIFCNSARVSNGPHRITVAAATPAISFNALFLASQSQTVQFFVHNKTQATPSLTLAANPSSAPTPIGGIAPPALVNSQNPVNYGADPTGTNDSTMAFQNALNTGDVLVPLGYFKILGHIFFPATTRHMQCTLSNGVSGAKQSFLVNMSTSEYQMFDIGGSTNSSIFYCGFRGPNADINARPAVNGSSQSFFIRVGNNSVNNQFVGNDFNGNNGVVGMMDLIAGSGAEPSDTVISWNTFEHCGMYAVQISAAKGTTTVSHNILNDCSGFVEGNVTSPATSDTGILIDSNHLTFTYGIGADEPNCAALVGFCGPAALRAGDSASGAALNYSGNTASNNIVDGPAPSGILENANGGAQNDAQYINNTCTGGCRMNNYQ